MTRRNAVVRYEPGGGLAAWIAAPLWGLARLVSSAFQPQTWRRGMARVRGSMFSGAAVNRLTDDWVFATVRSANQEVRLDHRRLVARARDLCRNNPHAARFLRLAEENVVGEHGIRLQARVTNAQGKQDDRTNQLIEGAWADWCRREHCTVDGRMDFVDVQRAFLRCWYRDGEGLLRLLPGRGKYGLQVQVIDPDQLDIDRSDPSPNNRGHTIENGIELDRWGRPVAFYVTPYHPSETERALRHEYAERIPAEQIVHVYDESRPGQLRGVTRFAPVLLQMKMHQGYREAEVTAARAGAAKMGFFRRDPEAVLDPDAPEYDEEVPMDAEPGSFALLPPGYEFQPWDPTHPSTAFPDFDRAMLRSIASGLGAAYSSLSGDLSDANYGSQRQGLLLERDVWMTDQGVLKRALCRVVYLEWLKWALTTQELQLPARNFGRWQRHEWDARRWPWIDPEKDQKAAALAIGLGLDSRTRIAREQGRDVEEVFRDLQRERELAAEYGIQVDGPKKGTGASASDDDDQDDDEPKSRAAQVRALLEETLAGSSSNGNGGHP